MARYQIPVTVHMFFLRGSQILLIRRFQTGYADGLYSVPAGHLDAHEPVRMAAVREGLEEVGITLTPEDLQFAGVIHRNEGFERVDFFMQVRRWEGEPFNAEPDKCDDLRWVEINCLPENTVPYVRQAIENWQQGIPFQEFGWE